MQQWFSWNKWVCDLCVVCRYCDTLPYFQSKTNYKKFGIHIQSWIEQEKRKLNRRIINGGGDRMSLTDELDLCDYGNVLSNKYKFLEIGKFLGVEYQTCNEITNKDWNMAGIVKHKE